MTDDKDEKFDVPQDEFEEDGDAMLRNPPHWLFELAVDGTPRGRVFGPPEKRNWVLWRLSKYAIEFESEGVVSVRRYNNGKWEMADDWRNLAH